MNFSLFKATTKMNVTKLQMNGCFYVQILSKLRKKKKKKNGTQLQICRGQIFIEHCGDNLQFYPNFELFSRLGGMNLDHDFFSGEQIK